MYRRAVPYDEQLTRDLAHEVLEEAHHVLSLEGLLLLDHVELAIERDAAHRRKVISCEVLLEDGRLPHRGVSANHHGQKIEARLIAEHYGSAFLQCPYLKRPDASSASAVCISAPEVSLVDRVRLHAMLAGRRRPVVVVRMSEALS